MDEFLTVSADSRLRNWYVQFLFYSDNTCPSKDPSLSNQLFWATTFSLTNVCRRRSRFYYNS